MAELSEILDYSKNKTRVLIYTSSPEISRLLSEVLQFNGKEFDFFSSEKSEKTNQDFVIFETADLEEASKFHPNIALITSEISGDDVSAFMTNIVAGGVLIFPESISETVRSAQNYFRKLPFENAETESENGNFSLLTEIGSLPLQTNDRNLIANLNGIKILAQQFGVMEEEFYEPAMGFV